MSRITLSSPLDLGAVTLKNRLALSPCAHRYSAEGDGLPGADTVETYFAHTRAGLILAEGAAISPSAAGDIGMAGIHTEAQRLAWSAVADAVHTAGSRIALPLLHAGRLSHRALQPGQALPQAPSTGRAFCYVTTRDDAGLPARRLCDPARSMEPRDIDAVVRDFREASVCALRAGVDLVEVDACRGMLLHQFLSREVNQRCDRYGGPLENRARLLLDIVDTLILQCGADRVAVSLAPVGMFGGLHDSEGAFMACHLAEELARRRIAYLRIVSPHWMHGPQISPQLRAHLRAGFDRTLVASGLRDAHEADRLLASGLIDVAGLAAQRLPAGWTQMRDHDARESRASS